MGSMLTSRKRCEYVGRLETSEQSYPKGNPIWARADFCTVHLGHPGSGSIGRPRNILQEHKCYPARKYPLDLHFSHCSVQAYESCSYDFPSQLKHSQPLVTNPLTICVDQHIRHRRPTGRTCDIHLLCSHGRDWLCQVTSGPCP